MNIYLVEDPFNIYNEVMYHMQKRNNILDISQLSELLFSAKMFEQKSIYSPKEYISDFETWRVSFSTNNIYDECIIKFEDKNNPQDIIEFTFNISYDKKYAKSFCLISLTHNEKQIPEADSVRAFFKNCNVKQAVNSLDIIEEYIKKVNFGEYVKQQTLIANQKNKDMLEEKDNLSTSENNVKEEVVITKHTEKEFILPSTQNIKKDLEEGKNLPPQKSSENSKPDNIEHIVTEQKKPVNNLLIKKLRDLFFQKDKNLDKSQKP